MALSFSQRDELEDEALRALSSRGRLQNDLVHGFRIHSDKGQLAAIYLTNNRPGNEIEVALCDNRLTDKYDIETVQRWLDFEKSKAPTACNAHKGASDWPIFGLGFNDALAFFRRVKKLRLGTLAAEDIAQLNQFASRQTPAQALDAAARATLAALRPVKRNAVIDLVYQAKVSVARWFEKGDGTAVLSPRSNPAYCYSWAFGGEQEPIVACIWHESLTIEEGRIVFRGNVRDLGRRLEDVAKKRGEDPTIVTRARGQAERARHLDRLLAQAHGGDREVRAIVNEGQMRSEENLGTETSVVRVRRLDDTAWNVEKYDAESGAFVLARRGGGVAAATQAQVAESEEITSAPEYVDQYKARGSDSPEKVATEGEAYARDRAVRDAALARAEGLCEFCNAPGFKTADGRIYMETHHVIPLSEKGADRDWNVAALCPNDHREAHYGERAASIRAQLLGMLAERYPPLIRP